MKISVTKAHIAKGIRCDCFQCPLALAIKGATLEDDVSVITGAWIRDKRYVLPKEAEDFKYAFDDLQKVEPFVFELPI